MIYAKLLHAAEGGIEGLSRYAADSLLLDPLIIQGLEGGRAVFGLLLQQVGE